MSFIRMKKDEVMPLCNAAIRRIAEDYKHRQEDYLQERVTSTNFWRRFWTLGLARPLTEDEVHHRIYYSCSLGDLHYYELCHPERDDNTLLAERLKTACQHAETICMSVEDLARLESHVSAERRSGPQETSDE